MAKVALIPTLLVSLAIAASHGNREREADGAYSPKDAHHHDKDGKHDSKFDREAILGSKKEVEEFEQLPPAEAKKKLGILAKKMDRNQDGFIDKVELGQWILRSLRMLSQEESDERFEDSDINKDGFVGWDEHKEADFPGVDEFAQMGQEGGPIDADTLDELAMMYEEKILFQAADVDGDGKLSKTEFFSFSHPEDNLDKMGEAVVKTAKDTKDKNSDGRIDFQEFVGDRGRDQDKDWLVAEKERFDTDLDKNKDGSMDDPEILDWIVPDSETIVKDEVKHLFASADDDHDDKLSMDEITNRVDVFLGSEATDYGEHLHHLDRFQDEL